MLMATISKVLECLSRHERERLENSRHLSVGLLAGDMASVTFLYEYSRFDPRENSVLLNSCDMIVK